MDLLEVTDLERMIDHLALEEGVIEENEVFDAVAELLDGPEDEVLPKLRAVVRELCKMRVADEKAFDVLCLKILCPGMTHDDLTTAMSALSKASWNHRARCYERVKGLLDKFPHLADVMVFDRRGGANRRKGVSGAQLRQEYEELKTAERKKPKHRRRPCYGENGLLAVLAKRHRIRGMFGKPSWQAAQRQMYR